MKRGLAWCSALVVAALALGADARPGGGSSFGGSRSSSSSSSRSSSSSSSYRSSSSSSSSRSSSSSYRSSSSNSGSSSYQSSDAPYTPPRPSEYAYRTTRGDAGALPASATTGSPYPLKPEHQRATVGPDTVSLGERILTVIMGSGMLFVVFGFFAFMFVVLSKLFSGTSNENANWSTAGTGESLGSSDPGTVRRELERIATVDPGFSAPVFEDFLATLYVEAHASRATPALANYSPYLRPEALNALAALGDARVAPIIVGAMRPVRFTADDALRLHRVEIELEANLTETRPGQPPQAFYARERWTLSRAYGARSRPPGRARSLTCPACGAPLDKTTRGTCSYCRQAVDSGQFDWVVERIAIDEREARPPMLTGTTEEQGTDSPTIVDPQLPVIAVQAAASGFDAAQLEARTRAIFAAMQHAWSSLAWDEARPFLSDRLWSAQTYWIAAYRSQGLRNVTENAEVRRVEMCRLSHDAYFVSATVRIHAQSLDYTLRDADQAVVGGSRTKPRPYTEYWTLLRSAAPATPQGAPCPACGAPLGNAMVSRCGYCGALVEASTFDWVLSRIDQDDVYRG